MNHIKSIHTSRTIMFAELEKVMAFSIDKDNYDEALKTNVIGKKSEAGAKNTAKYLKQLYQFDNNYPPFLALKYFWLNTEPTHRALLAFIFAANYDEILAQSVETVCKTPIGNKVTIAMLEENIEKYHPNKYSQRTRTSTAQNIASSWKQAGFIEGKVKNIRKQPDISPQVAAFAFFLAYLMGNRGDFIWNNTGVKALCLGEDKLRLLAVECAKRDLLKYQFAGSVTAISFENLLKKTGIDAIEN